MSTNLEIHRTVRAISIDLDYAIAFYETYVPTGQDTALIDRINKVNYYPAFNVISIRFIRASSSRYAGFGIRDGTQRT